MNGALMRGATKQVLLLQHKGDAETVIVEELGIQHGLSRIDLAVVNGELHGFELKRDRDTLARLPEQTETYGRVLDRGTLVIGERHLRRAVEIVPERCGLTVARVDAPEVHFSDLKVPINNPSLAATCFAMLLFLAA